MDYLCNPANVLASAEIRVNDSSSDWFHLGLVLKMIYLAYVLVHHDYFVNLNRTMLIDQFVLETRIFLFHLYRLIFHFLFLKSIRQYSLVYFLSKTINCSIKFNENLLVKFDKMFMFTLIDGVNVKRIFLLRPRSVSDNFVTVSFIGIDSCCSPSA